ncbi:PP2C family protein-serine/threonine phosphatase [Streptomyces sp. TR02-1]|uniref:PP2C family protein-serine/threonine phosphatase n=1 Tax=Streptomyces sp. TR02-1 TaxID=3385977 RepID=UPI0039A3A657
MSTPHPPKVAGFSPTLSPPSQTAPADRLAAVQGRLTDWIADLTALHDLTGRLSRADALDPALRETLAAGAALIGARRGVITLASRDAGGAEHTVGFGLAAAELGAIETVPRDSSSLSRLLDGHAAPDIPPPSAAGTTGPCDPVEERPRAGITHADIPGDETLHPRHREVAARLGFGASYALPLTAHDGTRLGAAVWLYDEPAEPTARQGHLLELYTRDATECLARHLELARARAEVAALREGLLPSRLPRVPGVRLAVRHRSGPRGGGDWYDALPLPEGALGLAVGGVTGAGAGATAAMGRLRASLRAYAVMEGEDPVAVLSDLELLLRLTEPARSATALFAYAEPATRRIVLAGAGHCPPLLTGPFRTEWVETTLSAPLGMLAYWEAPSVELTVRPGETVLLYSDGLLHRTGESTDRAYARLHTAVSTAPPEAADDPELLVDHVLSALLPEGTTRPDGPAGRENPEGPENLEDPEDPEDVVLLAARF